jgi:hypothetical protein
VHSLASEHLQQLENLVGPPRQKQEEVVVAALGSLYRGKVLCFIDQVHGTYGTSSAGLDSVRVSRIFPADFLFTPTIKTTSSINSLFLALALFPHVQRRAQAELDVVVGRDRLPTFDDRPHLPYIEAMCKELLRWMIVAPIGTIWDFL